MLRSSLAWATMSGRDILFFWLATDENHADAPSRNRDLAPPPPSSERSRRLLRPQRPRGFPGLPSATSDGCLGLEVRAGGGGLSRALEDAGLAMAVPIDVGNQEGPKQPHMDLENADVVAALLDQIADGCFKYIHFAVPCASWSTIQRMNGGSRRTGKPQGDERDPEECRANGLAEAVALLIEAQVGAGGYFSVENPNSSHLWDFPRMKKALRGHYAAVFDQRQYGLHIRPDNGPTLILKKRTRLVSNLAELSALSVDCPGGHVHSRCLGSARIGGRRQDLARAAGAHPPGLCKRWAGLVGAGLRKELRPPAMARG